MIPVAINTSVIPPAPLLVNTNVPGSVVVRPPHDNVVPSISSAEVYNNTKGNSSAARGGGSAAASVASAGVAPFYSFLSSASADGVATSQTNFFAQLLGQGGGEDARALLVVYEKLLSLSQVRYKPSNASAPAPEPAGVFGRLLQQERVQERAPVTVDLLSVEEVVLPQEDDGAPVIQPRATTALLPAPAQDDIVYNYEVRPSQPAPAPKAAEAYTASIVRNNTPDESPALESA